MRLILKVIIKKELKMVGSNINCKVTNLIRIILCDTKFNVKYDEDIINKSYLNKNYNQI